jgi:hypothetical protein
MKHGNLFLYNMFNFLGFLTVEEHVLDTSAGKQVS